jgi:PAS domain S-box-containing protein
LEISFGMLWLYMLAAVTVLVIALRRVMRRQQPLDDQLYSSRVAVDHVHSGVAWVRADGTIGSMNPSLAGTLGIKHGELNGHDWLLLFPPRERSKVSEVYSQMLLLGIASTDIYVERSSGTQAWLNMVLVAVHDHKSSFVGHHCLTEDRTRERQLEEKVKQLTAALADREAERRETERHETERQQTAETR